MDCPVCNVVRMTKELHAKSNGYCLNAKSRTFAVAVLSRFDVRTSHIMFRMWVLGGSGKMDAFIALTDALLHANGIFAINQRRIMTF